MNWRFQGLEELGIVGSMPTAFWGEMYANFGIVGVLLTPLLVGILLYLIEYVMKRIYHNPITIGLYVWLILHYKDLSFGGLSKFIIDFYLIIVLLIVTMLSFVVGKGKIRILK